MIIEIGMESSTIDESQLLSGHMKNYQEYLKYKYESLELISPLEMLDNFSTQYVDLTLVKDNQQWKIKQEQDRKCDTVNLAEALDVHDSKKKIILIEGAPGVGKSTLAINICKQWAKGDLLQSYVAVILLTLRDPEIQGAKTISDLLLILDDEMRDGVFKDIVRSSGDNICFIFEGYDELPQHLCKSPVFAKLTEKLLKSTLVYTSRPEACDELQVVASKIIRIVGFNEESVDDYITKTFEKFEDGKEQASALRSQVQSNPVVKSILCIPINVAIVCYIFFHFSRLPETLTELYTLLCLRLILRHITTRTPNEEQVKKLQSLDDLPEDISEQFSQLCCIAYQGIKNLKIIFSSQDLVDIGINEDKVNGLGLLLIAPTTSVYGREKSYNFLYRTLQEFCAAWYISKLSTEEQLKYFNIYRYDFIFQVISRFYSGITGLKNEEILNCLLPYKPLKTSNTWTWMGLLELAKFIYEAHSNKVCQIIGDHFDGEFVIKNHGLPLYDSEILGLHALDYVLTEYKGALKLNYHFTDEMQCEGLFELLKKKQHAYDTVAPTYLAFRFWRCSDYQKCHPFIIKLLTQPYYIKELYISIRDSLLDSYGMSFYSLSQIIASSSTLTVLDVSKISIDCESELCLVDCRHVVLRHLKMSSCYLHSKGADRVGKIVSHYKSIVCIDLFNSFIGDNGVEQIVCHLNNNNRLQHIDLSYNRISEVGVYHLTKLLSTNSPTLTSIDLSDNPLCDNGVHLLLQSITTKMEHIGLSCWALTSSSYQSIATAIHYTRSIRLGDFNDSCNWDVIIESLSTTSALEQLAIKGDCFTKNKLIDALKQNESITTLELSFREYADSCKADLVQYIKYSSLLTKLVITDELPPSQGLPLILLIADALATNKSIKTMTCELLCPLLPDRDHGWVIVLKVLEQLKQAFTLEELMLKVSSWNFSMQMFQKAKDCVKEINNIRSANHAVSLLRVNIVEDLDYELWQIKI